MASPAKDARLQAAANGFTEITGRKNNSITARNPTNNKNVIIAQVGGGWHYNGDQETDTAWETAVAPWDHKIEKAPYNAYALSNFKSGQILKWVDPTTGESVAFQPQALKYTNDYDQIQIISNPQSTTAIIDDDKITWEGAYGTGRDYSYVAGPTRMQKLLRIAEALPSTSYTILELGFVMAPSSGVVIYVDGAIWDRKSTIETAQEVLFKTSEGGALWAFTAPIIYDSAENSANGILRFRKSGNKLYCSVRFEKTWLDTAVFPIYLDPTIDTQVSTSYDDGYWADTALSKTATYNRVGAYLGIYQNTYARFQGITIPDGAIIDIAYVSVYVHSQTGDVSPCTTRFEDDDDPAQITSASDATGRAKTTESVSWSLPSSGWSNSPSIIAMIEELMESYSYASGAAMQVYIFGNNTSGNDNYKNIRGFDGWHTTAAKIYIEYTSEGSGAAIAAIANHYRNQGGM